MAKFPRYIKVNRLEVKDNRAWLHFHFRWRHPAAWRFLWRCTRDGLRERGISPYQPWVIRGYLQLLVQLIRRGKP